MGEKRADDRPPRRERDDPVLPQVSEDERAEGWGEDPRERGRDEEWYRRQVPPHHE